MIFETGGSFASGLGGFVNRCPLIPFKIYEFHDFRDRVQSRVWAGGVFLIDLILNFF